MHQDLFISLCFLLVFLQIWVLSFNQFWVARHPKLLHCNEVKGQSREREEYLQIIYVIRGWYRKYVRTPQQNKLIFLKDGHNAWTDFSKAITQMAKRCEKICSVPLLIREMQTQASMKYDLTPVRMAIIIKKMCIREAVEKGNLCTLLKGNLTYHVLLWNSTEAPITSDKPLRVYLRRK